MSRVEGKVAIVTGGAKGLGKETCLILVKEGAKVAVTHLLDKEGVEVVSEIKKNGGTAKFYHMDITKEDEIDLVFFNIYI